MTKNEFLQRLDIEYPIVQAPMAGGFTTPELIAAVSNAGGLGSLGAAYMSPEQIAQTIANIRKLTSRPFNVNLFAGGYAWESHADPEPILSMLGEIHESLGLTPPLLPPISKDPFDDQLEVILETRPPVFSFTFGVPNEDSLRRLRAAGITVMGTATTVEEAQYLEGKGIDAVVAQGLEAGGHRGTFLRSFETSMVPTMTLVRQIVSTVAVPTIASGGLMDGRDITESLKLGASAAQLGTAFMTCPEAGTPLAHKQVMLSTHDDSTVITRAFSGRPARGLTNDFVAMLQHKEDIILPFPIQNTLTRAIRNEATKRGDARFLSLWAGTGVSRTRALPAAELVSHLVEEMSGCLVK